MKTFRRLLKVLSKHQRRLIVILLLMMVAGAGLETIGTSLLLPVIEIAMDPAAVLGNRYMRFVYNLLHLTSTEGFLMLIITAIIIIYIVKNLYLYLMYYAQYRFVYRGQYLTSRAVFKDYVDRPYEFFLDASTPLMIRHVCSDVAGTYSLLLTYLQLFTEAAVFIALFCLSLAMSPGMTLIMACVVALILLINKQVFGPILRRYGNDVMQNNANVTKWLMQAMNGMKETKVLNREKYFVDQYDNSASKLCKIQVAQSSMNNIPRLSIETVMVTGILLMVGIFLGDTADIGPMMGRMTILAYVAMRIMPSANRIANYVNQIAYYTPSLNAVEDIILHSHDVRIDDKFEGADTIAPLPFQKEVVLDRITYRYPGTETDILRDATLDIPIGKSIGLIGPSGAGKSTTVDILLGLLRPRAGKITVDGTDISTNLPGWYADIGYVPQLMFMLDDTIRANIAYGIAPDKIDDCKIWHVLQEAQLDDYVRSLPEGLDTCIGERGMRISGGQRQRIAIARALYNDPQIMIFDEATSALDNDTEKAIMDAIEQLHGRKTLIIVAHRLTTIEKCDAVYRVENQQFERVR